MMIKNYLTVAFRYFRRHKAISLINILGLAIGMFACICVLQYVYHEKSFDKFHLNRENLYRVQYNFYKNGEKKIESASAVPAVGPAMKDNFPEIIDFTRIFKKAGIISFKNSNYWENQVYAVTPSFFNVFSFSLVKGDPKTALSGPFKIVLTESAAHKYFGENDPVGQMIRWDGEHEGSLNFEVTGICKDVPDNSHIKFSFLLSYQTFINIRGDGGQILENDWHWYDFYTYVLLKPESNPVDFQNKFSNWLKDQLDDVWSQYGIIEEFLLQPIEDIHLNSHLTDELDPDGQGDAKTVNVMILVAVFILIIAWVNYINLSAAQAAKRAKNVGIRKVSGALRGQLIRQFISESASINMFALILAVLISALLFPMLNHFINIELSLNLLFTKDFWLFFGSLFLAGIVLTSLYPAFIISSFKSITVLKGNILKPQGGMQLRKYLVIFQFIASIILIVVVLVVSNQLEFMQNQNLKIDIANKLVIKGPTKIGSDSDYISQEIGLRNEMLKQSQVLSFSSGTKIPGLEVSSKQGVRKKEDSPDAIQSINVLGIDYNYVPSFKISLVSGRAFSKTFQTDKSAILINESAVKMMGYENPEKALGHEIFFGDDYFKIIGVVEDYHHMSLKKAPVPLLYHVDEYCNDYFVLKTSGENIESTIKAIEAKWQQFFPGNPFDYFFLNDFYAKQYRADLGFRNAMALFSMIAFLIAGMGLFSLSLFAIEQRFKEIGIRKVNGAKISEVLVFLNGEFVKWVLIAFLIAIPISYFAMHMWLENFAYKTSLSWWIFALAGILALGIALLTVSWQSWRAATRNPVEALRYE